MNFLKSIAQGQAASQNITTGQNFLFWSLHSWKSDGCQNKNYSDSKADHLQRVTYSKRVLLEERMMIYVASVFKVLQSCDAGPRKILPPVRTFCFDHFTENQMDVRIKITAIQRQTICRESLIRNVRYWKRGWWFT